jgi:hypothetical protein
VSEEEYEKAIAALVCCDCIGIHLSWAIARPPNVVQGDFKQLALGWMRSVGIRSRSQLRVAAAVPQQQGGGEGAGSDYGLQALPPVAWRMADASQVRVGEHVCWGIGVGLGCEATSAFGWPGGLHQY